MDLVIGASGLVGGAMLAALARRARPGAGTCHGSPASGLLRLDIRNREETICLVESVRPRTVFLPAAMTNVDACETAPEASRAVNVDGVRHVQQACARAGARLVYFSTDYVFDGLDGPYTEDALVAPLSVYGRHKAEAEQIVMADARGLVVRTTWVYGHEAQGKNFVARVAGVLGSGGSLRVPLDQFGSPTYAPSLAEVSLDLADAEAAGVVHAAGPSVISRVQFAVAIAHEFALPEQGIQGVPTSELGQAARRPLRAGLLCGRAVALCGSTLVDYPEGLRLMRQREKA